jgi:L-cysteine S-thiosulfotransferase
MSRAVKLKALLLLCLIPAMSAAAPVLDRIAMGKAIAFDRNAGNCLSCHMIADGELPGLIGPPLIQMKVRFPDRSVLRAQIWDPAIRNPDTVMPPYGRHSILTEDEVDLIVDFIYSI